MPASTQSQIAASVVILLGVAFIWVADPPFFVTAIFMALCVAYSACNFIAVFRGTDELKSASVRYGLAAASAFGVPLSLAFVMLMIATPGVQDAITTMAAASKSGMPPAAVGFAMGVTFTVIVLCILLVIANAVWWTSKR